MDQSFATLAGYVVLLAVVGALSGVIAGLLGVGGGIVIVPALYYVLSALGAPEATLMPVCVATSLATIVPTSIRSARAHAARGTVDRPVLTAWAPWMVLGAVLGVIAAAAIGGRAMTAVFGVVAFVVALQMGLWTPPPGGVLGAEPPKGALGAAWGGGVGFFSAIMGIGGGTLGVPALSLYAAPIHRAVATAAGFGVLIAVPATLGYLVSGLRAGLPTPPFTIGYLNLPAFALITPLTILCAPYGVKLAYRLNATVLKRVFALFLAITALNMLRRAGIG